MNRIGGILHLDHNVANPIDLDRMSAVMNLSLREPRRHILDENIGMTCVSVGSPNSSRPGKSPYPHPERQCTIVFDGRLDNRQELLAVLDLYLPVDRDSLSNEEIVLSAYLRWGLDFPRYLIGDFALALWDKREQKLVCARDQFGVRPFYYSCTGNTFVFASTQQGVVASGEVAASIDEARIADFLTEYGTGGLEGIDLSSTFYRDVYRLPPAHLLVVNAHGMALHRYWQAQPVDRAGLKNEEQTIQAFREILGEAVRCRLVDGAPAASMLSGGLDSSAIVGTGRRILAGGEGLLQVIAVISNSVPVNRETPHIRSVLGGGKLQAELVSETEILQSMDGLVGSLEYELEPFDCLMNLNRSVYLHAAKRDFGAVLDGVDGNLLLNDYGILPPLLWEGKLKTVLDETIHAGGVTAEYKWGKNAFYETLRSLAAVLAPDWMWKARKRLVYRKATPRVIKNSIIDPDLAARSRLWERFARVDFHNPRPSFIDQMEYHKIGLESPFLTVALERYERVAGSFGIEARHPLLDIRLVEFCLGLPWQLKTHGGWTKMILRRALEPDLPLDVVWRTDKDSLMWEVNRLILKERAEYFHQVTLDASEFLRPYVDILKLESCWKEYLSRGEEKHANKIWSGTALALWLRQHRTLTAKIRSDQ